MKNDDTTQTTDSNGRRKFLKGVVSTGGAATAVLAAPSIVSTANANAKDSPQPLQKGYHETQHIEDYYQTTRI